MVRRSLGVALWSLVGLLACFLGGLGALVGTGAGRALLAGVAEGAVARVVSGRIEVGDVGGSLLTGLTLSDVKLYDPDTSLVAVLPRAELSYNPFDFVAGRIVLLELTLRRPVINIVQHRSGRLNLEELLRLGVKDSGGPHGPAALVLFRNVTIDDGSVVLRLQDRVSPDDSAHEIDAFGSDGRRRIRRFEHLDARLAALRFSSPSERGIFADITRLAVESSDPAVRLVDVAGRLTVLGDSIDLDLARVRLPASELAGRGRIRWPRDTLLYDLALRADSVTLGDVRFLDARYPARAVLRGRVALRSRSARLLEVRLDPLDLAFGAGSLSGRVTAFSAADSGLVAVRGADLVASDLDLELVRPFLDSLPFTGHLTGHTLADGRTSALSLEIDWVFRDSLVAGWPETRIRGQGELDLAAATGGGMRFQPFHVEEATVAFGTVRRLVPAVALQGTLDAAGTLTGTWTDAGFSGTLRHRDGERPASVVRGVIALDSRTDTLGISADVIADSVSWEGLKGSFPGLPLAGAAAGSIRLEGTLAALETHADLVSAEGGRVRGDGVLILLPPHYGVRDFTLRAGDLDLRRWIERGPASRLTFTLSGSVAADSAVPPFGAVTATLEPSVLAGAVLDSGVAQLRFADGRLHLDSLRLAQSGLITSGSGSLGWDRSAAGALVLELDADSLSTLDSLVGWLAGAKAIAVAPGEVLAGRMRATVTLSGSIDSIAVEARVRGENLRWRRWGVPAGEGRLAYEPGPVPGFELAVSLDSLGRDRLGFGAVSVAARGTRDSLGWFARSRLGDLGAFLAGGRFARRQRDRADGGTAAVELDSLALLLPGGIWFLEAPTALVIGDSVASITGLTLKNVPGPGRLVLEGDLTRGRANASLHLEGFPLAGVYALLQRDTLGVGGAITASFGLTGSRADPVYRGSFALNEGSFGSFRTPFLDGTVEYRARRLDAAVHLWRSGQQILDVTARLPLDLSLTPVKERQLPETLSVRALADSVDLAVLEALTPVVQQVSGVFSADLGVGGTWGAPRLRGQLRIASAAATIPALNVRYEGVNGRLRLTGDTIRVESLSARSGKGRAEVSGHVRLERLTHPLLRLDIAAEEFKALELRGYLSLTASGQLSLTGPVFGATLTGRATVTSGVLHFADLVTKRVVNLDEPWVATLIDTSLIRQQRLGPAFESVYFDSLRIRELQLAMGSDVWLRSNEANIQLTGTVSVTKEGRNFLVSGTLQAPRGTYRLVVGGPVTREFVVSQGTVRYFGTPDLDAQLNIEAKHVVHPVPLPDRGPTEDLTIVVHIGGTLLVPRLTLSAEGRDLSQTEIISYLLFGQPSVELAGEQGTFANRSALVRSALASIVSGELERSIVSDLGVPLDYVEIRPGDPTDPFSGARFAAGVQIGKKTFLVVNAGFCEGRQIEVQNTLGLSLQFRVSPEWRTEASFEPLRTCGGPVSGNPVGAVTRQVGLDLFWEKRY